MNDHFPNRDKFIAMLSNRKWSYIEVTPILRLVNSNIFTIQVRDVIETTLMKLVAQEKSKRNKMKKN